MFRSIRSSTTDGPLSRPSFRPGLVFIAWAIVLATHWSSSVAADVDEGMALAQRVHERPDGADASTRSTMILREADGGERIREMFTFRLDKADGSVLTLIRFTSPSNVDGTGLLMHEHADGATDQWLFLSALERQRRIASGRRGGRFVGSDLYFEDLEDRDPALDRHSVVGRERVNDILTTVLESVPEEPDTSIYSRRVSWVHEETLIPVRVDYYDGGDTASKRMTVQRIERIDGYWTALETVMTDLQTDHETVITVDVITYDRGLPESLFTRRALEDPAQDAEYRP